MLEFFIAFPVTPKQTKENRLVTTKDGKTYMGRFTPRNVRINAEMLGVLARKYRPDEPLKGVLSATYRFQTAWRASETKKWKDHGWRYKDTSPDVDNLAKQMSDVLQSVGFFANDACIAVLHCTKVWMRDAGVHVTLNAIGKC